MSKSAPDGLALHFAFVKSQKGSFCVGIRQYFLLVEKFVFSGIFLVEAIPSRELRPHALLGSTNHILPTFSCLTPDARRPGRDS